MCLKSLFFLFFFFNSLPIWGAGSFPLCSRPKDFSVQGNLKKFEVCQKLQRKYCDKNEKDSRCRVFLKNPLSYIENKFVGDECRVLSNGQYRCKERSLRFVEKGVMPQPKIQKAQEPATEEVSPEATPAASPTASPSP